MALVAKITLERGRRAALSVILATSAEAFTIVRLAGAAYLVYLGVQTLRSSFRHETVAAVEPRRGASPPSI